MIKLSLSRQDLEAVRNHFFPFIELLKQTRLNNVAHASIQSDEYLTTLVVNAVIGEISEVVEKKYQKLSTGTLTLKFSDAQGLLLYRLLMLLNIPSTEVYFSKLRSDLIFSLDAQFIQQALYQAAVAPADMSIDSVDYEFDDE